MDNQTDHSPVHAHTRIVDQHQLLWAIGLSSGMMVLEIAGGIWTQSLALLSDAFHMFTHIFALGVSLLAVRLTVKPATFEKTFGYYRAETLAAVINGTFLIFVTIFIIYEAIKRFVIIQDIAEIQMLIIASAGLVVNLITAGLLMRADRENLNIRSAFLHMIGDAASSIAIIIGGGIIYFTHWYYLDPLMSIIIALVIVYWAFSLLRDAIHVLMQGSPKHLNAFDIDQFLRLKFSDIRGIHDIHVWELAQRMYIFSAHIVINDRMLSTAEQMGERMSEMLQTKFAITHTNFQFETGNSEDCHCHFQAV
ncbi:MAG: cation diffusion facilitator family transporter [Patescibacteria group bacterium]|nr:cation diffusion facilitator family transporter [Patescibacteria group bacterium]